MEASLPSPKICNMLRHSHLRCQKCSPNKQCLEQLMPVAFSNSLLSIFSLISKQPIYFGPCFYCNPICHREIDINNSLFYIAKMQLDSSHGGLVYSLVALTAFFLCLLYLNLSACADQGGTDEQFVGRRGNEASCFFYWDAGRITWLLGMCGFWVKY